MPFTFRPDTTDAPIVDAIWRHGEYWLPERFAAGDVVIDAGCHIGGFLAACLDRGCRLAVGFEADPANARLAETHLQGDPRAIVRQLALWRSDTLGPETLRHSGYGVEQGMVNTGSGDVFASDGPRVITVALDEVLGIYGAVRVLKLDCEGSEFPILVTSRLLRQVQTIVGEVHEYGGPHDTLPPPLALPSGMPWTGAALGHFLAGRGYTVRLTRKLDAAGRPTRLLGLHAERRDP